MKKLLSLVTIIVMTLPMFRVSAQERMELMDGVYLVTYGENVIIEDDIHQQSISMTVSQIERDERTNEAIYEVVCGDWTKTVVNAGLKKAFVAGIANAIETGGLSLFGSMAALAANEAYKYICDYYGEQYDDSDE